MNYEEMSKHQINMMVDEQLKSKGLHNLEVFDLNNPADWVMLIKEMTPNFTVEFDDNYVSATYCGDINMDPIRQSYGSAGRAMSICYLKSFDLLKKVKKCEIKNKKDEKLCYSEGFNSAEGDVNPYLFIINPWAYTPWKRGHAAKWGG